MMPVFVITLSDVISLTFFGLMLLFILGWALRDAWRQWRCKHESYYENSRNLDAICRGCGKNLGFIGTVRQREKEQNNGSK